MTNDREEVVITRAGHEPVVVVSLKDNESLKCDENAWEDYLWWQAQDGKVLKRISILLAEIQRNGNQGIGKPEALKHDYAGVRVVGRLGDGVLDCLG